MIFMDGAAGGELLHVKLIVLDFDGVLTDNRVIVMQDGSEAVMCSRSDGLGIEAVRHLGVDFLVLSTERNPVVARRCEKLGLACISGCDDKPKTLEKEISRRGYDAGQVAYVGNDINDIDCLDMVGVPVCVADAWPEVRQHARLVTGRKGGRGAVREFCDMVVEAHRKATQVP